MSVIDNGTFLHRQSEEIALKTVLAIMRQVTIFSAENSGRLCPALRKSTAGIATVVVRVHRNTGKLGEKIKDALYYTV